MPLIVGRRNPPAATDLWGGCVRPKLIVVEGMDEVSLLQALLPRIVPGAEERFQLYSADGKSEIPPFVRALTRSTGFGALVSLAVIRDADHDPRSAFTSVREALERGGLAVPEAPGQVAPGSPSVGVFIVPGAAQDGALEDLCLRAFSEAGDPAITCVEGYLDCIARAGIAVEHRNKAASLAFLASRPRQPARFGYLADEPDWPWDSPVWDNLKAFLTQL